MVGSKIVLRGNNSLTGDNQPLIVVDGVPRITLRGFEQQLLEPSHSIWVMGWAT